MKIGNIVKLEAQIIGESVENGERYLRLSKEEGRSILVPAYWVEPIAIKKTRGGEKENGLSGNTSE